MTGRLLLHENESLGAAVLELGALAPGALGATRLAMHWAAQVAAAVGFTYAPARDDFSHTTLRWDDAASRFVSQPTAAGLAGFVGVADAVVGVIDARGAVRTSMPIEGSTLDELYAFVAEAVAEGATRSLVRPEHDLPDHPVARGARFDPMPEGERRELSRWFCVAQGVVASVVRTQDRASALRIWPHHFDVATLIELGDDRSVGVGFSPGDTSYAEPYIYVTPWPYPEGPLPELQGGGRWHTDGWTGAVLDATTLLGADAQARIDVLESFVTSATGAALQLQENR